VNPDPSQATVTGGDRRARHPLRAALVAHAAAEDAPAADVPAADVSTSDVASDMPAVTDPVADTPAPDASAANAPAVSEPAAAEPVVTEPAAAKADRQSSEPRALRAALAAYAREDYPAAARMLTTLAQAGDPEAQYRLGLLYARGKGVLGNLGDGIVWYRRAAEQGHAEAQFELSLAYVYGGHAHYDVGRWYDGAAEIDKSAADNNLELMFPNGINVPQDHPEALRWSIAAAPGRACTSRRRWSMRRSTSPPSK